MKNIFKLLALSVLAVALSASASFAAPDKKDEADEDTLIWRYEVEATAGQATQGSIVLKVWSYSKKRDIATAQAGKNAVHAVLFKGVPALNTSTARVPAQKPIITDINVDKVHADFFEAFFQDGGDYNRFVNFQNNGFPGPGDIIKVGKEFKIGITVSVNKDALRKAMEAAGIVKPLGGNLKKPIIMVVPSDLWCKEHGFEMTYNDQGVEKTLPNYRKALQSDANMLLAISKINELMAERDFPLKNLEASLKSLEYEAAETAMLTSKSGSSVAESPIDVLKRVASADIWLQLTYTINQIGPKRSLTFNLQGLDAYTDKEIATVSGTGGQALSTVELPILIEEAVLSHLDNYNANLQRHFDNVQKEGREIHITVETWEDAGFDLTDEFDGEELGYIITEWLADETVDGNAEPRDPTDKKMYFNQIRIPLEMEVNGKIRKVDAYRWVGNLRRHLKNTYGIESKLSIQGLSKATLVLGEK